MSSSTPAILYDIPTKKPEYGSWSPNVWKTRLALNYKGIPYTTQWLLHQDLASTLSNAGFLPNPAVPGGQLKQQPSPYTVPAVQLSDGTKAMDSAVIAAALETYAPEPSLRLETRLHETVLPVIGQLAFPLLAVLFPRIGRDVLLDEVVPGWKAKREAQFGMPLEQFEAARGGETAWKAAEPGLAAMSKFLREHKRDEGPFLLGSQVCYGDFIIAGLLESSRRVGQDIFDRMVSYDENLAKLHAACAEWFENDR